MTVNGYGTKRKEDKSMNSSIKTLAALLMVGAAFAACSSSDDSIAEQQPTNPTEPQVYTMTIEATKSTGDDATTRGLLLNGKTLNVKWNEGEKVDVLQYIGDNKRALRGTLTATASDGGTTTLTGTVSDVDENEELEFYLHGYDRSYKGQTGVLLKPATGTDNSIETNYDYGIASVEKGGFSINGSTVSVPGGVTFTSEQAIIKFSFVDAITTMPFTVSSLSISGTFQSQANQNVELSYNWLTGVMENGTLTVEPTTPASSFYVALKAGFSDTYGNLSLNAVGQNSINYTYEKSNVTLERGQFYEITVKMHPIVTVEAVDLGLSVKWAPMNVGATTETDRGFYFAWAGTTGYAYESGHNFSEENAPYSYYNTYSKYIGSDDYTALQAEDDAATANWGGSWRMPTKAEWEELKNNCTAEWKENYKGSGINGILFTSTKDGFTDKSIFLPANGHYKGTDLLHPTIWVLYWSSNYDLQKDGNNHNYTNYSYAYVFDVSYGNNQFTWRNPSTTARCRGVAVRPVCP